MSYMFKIFIFIKKKDKYILGFYDGSKTVWWFWSGSKIFKKWFLPPKKSWQPWCPSSNLWTRTKLPTHWFGWILFTICRDNGLIAIGNLDPKRLFSTRLLRFTYTSKQGFGLTIILWSWTLNPNDQLTHSWTPPLFLILIFHSYIWIYVN